MIRGFTVMAVSVLVSGCATISASTRARHEAQSAAAVAALQAADFDQAAALAQQALALDDTNARAHAASGLARFVSANRSLAAEVMTLGASVLLSAALRSKPLSLEPFDAPFERADARLAEVDRQLEAAERDEGVSLELCLACWQVDWNRNGAFDEFDQQLLEVERNADGTMREKDDARRRPVFRFDVADVHWLHALVSFERAGLELARAWNFSQVLGAALRTRPVDQLHLVVPLRSAERARHAQALMLSALAESRECRAHALAELDDDREWLPNPLQRSHPVPLPVDVALYDDWNLVLTDLEALMRSQRGLDLAELAALEARYSSREPLEVHGFMDLGRLLSMPEDLTLELGPGRQGFSSALHTFLGKALVDSMPPSQLPQHLGRLQREVSEQVETLEYKLRYLLWLN